MHREIVVVAASRGALPVLKALVEGLSQPLEAAVLIVLHIGRHPSLLPELLSGWGGMPASFGKHGETIQRGRIYVAPPDRHMVVRHGRLQLLDTAHENFCRPSADPLFRSAAAQYGERAVGLVLTGELDDGAAGLAAIGARGGYRIVQDPEDAEAPSMPRSAIAAAGTDAVAWRDGLADALRAAVNGAPRRKEPEMSKRPDLDREAQIGEGGLADPDELDEIAVRSPLTCPTCNGVLWRLRDDHPLRFRCHTGHAFSALSLDTANAEGAADAIWSAIRAVRERMILVRERQEWARRTGNHADVAREQAHLEGNEKIVELLHAAANAYLS